MTLYRGPTLFDANVVIDYAQTAPMVLTAVVEHIGPVHVPSPVLREVEPTLDQASATALGLTPSDPTLPQIAEASQRGGPLSFQDRLCFAMARDAGWLVVTNDRRLRSKCVADGVAVDWGLNPMLWLVVHGAMTAQRAMDVAQAIHCANSFLSADIVERFAKKLGLP